MSQIDFLLLNYGPIYWKIETEISGQTILSSPQDVAVNPNFAKNRDIPVVTRPVTPVLPIDKP